MGAFSTRGRARQDVVDLTVAPPASRRSTRHRAGPGEGGTGPRLLASALFGRIDVLGVQEATVHLSAHAVRHGLAAALPEEMGILVSGRGERSGASISDAGTTVHFDRGRTAHTKARSA